MQLQPAKEHAARIRIILNLIQNEPFLKPHVTSKLVESLEKLAEKWERGDFEELDDVEMLVGFVY